MIFLQASVYSIYNFSCQMQTIIQSIIHLYFWKGCIVGDWRNMNVVVVSLQRAHNIYCKIKGIEKYNKCDFKTSQPFSWYLWNILENMEQTVLSFCLFVFVFCAWQKITNWFLLMQKSMDQASGLTCYNWSPNCCFCRLVSSVMRSGGLWASPHHVFIWATVGWKESFSPVFFFSF